MIQRNCNEFNNERIIKNYKRLMVISITNLLCNQLPMILMFGWLKYNCMEYLVSQLQLNETHTAPSAVQPHYPPSTKSYQNPTPAKVSIIIINIL